MGPLCVACFILMQAFWRLGSYFDLTIYDYMLISFGTFIAYALG